eukprot:scaffold511_cov412-Pavlova_lutheri.AAC.2
MGELQRLQGISLARSSNFSSLEVVEGPYALTHWYGEIFCLVQGYAKDPIQQVVLALQTLKGTARIMVDNIIILDPKCCMRQWPPPVNEARLGPYGTLAYGSEPLGLPTDTVTPIRTDFLKGEQETLIETDRREPTGPVPMHDREGWDSRAERCRTSDSS